jgi:glycosyltransferase involved in cell wall biosynthesis
MRSWRVGLVCGYLDPRRDGVADYTRHLSDALQSAGLEARICTAHDCVRGSDEADVVGVTGRWDAGGVIEATRQLRRLRLDLVHVQFAPSAFGFSRAVGLLPLLLPRRLPIVVTLHEYGVWAENGIPAPLRSAAWAPLELYAQVDRETLFLTSRATRLLVVAEDHARVLRQRFPRSNITADYVPVGPNIARTPGDRDHLRREVRKELNMPVEAPLVVFFGFLHPVKGLHRLIESLAVVRPSLPGVRLVIAGGQESHSVVGKEAQALRRRLEEIAHRHQVEHDVTFTGYLPEADVSRLLQAADVAVFPFDNGVTSKSGSLIAARTHGVPVIATAAPGTLAGVTEMDGVVRVPPRDTPALVAALRLVFGDRRVVDNLLEANQEYVAVQSWKAVAERHLEIYADVLHGHR